MISYPPPPPMVIAQVFNDPGNTFQVAPPATSFPATTSASAQHAVDTIAVPNYLKSKYIGIESVITNADRQFIGQGTVLNIAKNDGAYYTCTIQNPETGEQLSVRVIFEGFVQDAPSQKRWAMTVAPQVKDKRLLEAESQLSTMVSALGSDSTVAAINPSDRVPEPAPDLLPPGEDLQVLDIKTMQMAKQLVVIYKGNAYLSTGVPLNVRLEYQP